MFCHGFAGARGAQIMSHKRCSMRGPVKLCPLFMFASGLWRQEILLSRQRFLERGLSDVVGWRLHPPKPLRGMLLYSTVARRSFTGEPVEEISGRDWTVISPIMCATYFFHWLAGLCRLLSFARVKPESPSGSSGSTQESAEPSIEMIAQQHGHVLVLLLFQRWCR